MPLLNRSPTPVARSCELSRGVHQRPQHRHFLALILATGRWFMFRPSFRNVEYGRGRHGCQAEMREDPGAVSAGHGRSIDRPRERELQGALRLLPTL